MITTVFFDVDGVLTDGKVYVSENGSETKKINFEDIDAVFALKRAGIKIGFITGEDTEFCSFVQNRFKPDYFIKGCKDKLSAFKKIAKEKNLKKENICFVGDSRKDIELLNYLNYSLVPADVPQNVQNSAKVTLKVKRGEGIIKEASEYIFKINNVHKDIDKEYFFKIIDEHLEIVKAIKNNDKLLQSLKKTADILLQAYKNNNKLLICGNGGSAADAQHIATEFVSRFYLERKALDAEALTVNTSSLTAIGNDYNFDIVFSRQVEAKGRKGDVLLAITTSGNSKNVIKAVEKAREIAITTIGFTGDKKNIMLEKCVDVCVKIPSVSTPRIQEAHILLAHIICEYVEEKLFKVKN